MRIGIDLDNTLIDYTEAFVFGAKEMGLIPEKWNGRKAKIREFIRNRPEGEQSWEALQGKVYGRWIGKAQLYPGSFRFLWRCSLKGWFPIVVSHKTKFGHYDPEQIPLREAAMNFLKLEEIWKTNESDLLGEIYFESSRAEKLQTIENLGLDVFIDDLPEVLEDPNFPNSVRSVLFDPYHQHASTNLEKKFSWEGLSNLLLGEWEEYEIIALAEYCKISEVKSLKAVRGGGNSRIYCVNSADQSYSLKLYPEDPKHDRVRSEFDGINLIFRSGIKSVPEPIGVKPKLNVASFKWIEGQPIENPLEEDIQDCVEFLKNLQKLKGKTEFNNFPHASAACFSGEKIESQLNTRLDQLRQVDNDELNYYLDEHLEKVMIQMLARAHDIWPDQGFANPLDRKFQILSPSDFGFHNILKCKEGKLVFYDFEYFGWDDPVKLICDFAFHPGMELNQKLRQHWYRLMLNFLGEDLTPRLNASWPLYGLCWVMILLNEFLGQMWERRRVANAVERTSRKQILTRQLHRSQKMLKHIDESVRTQTFDFQ